MLPTSLRDALVAALHPQTDAYDRRFLLTDVANRPDDLDRLARDLAAAGLRLQALRATPDGRVAIRTDDNDLARALLRRR